MARSTAALSTPRRTRAKSPSVAKSATPVVERNSYLTSDGAAHLKAYRYVGSDNSLIYKHILTPMNIFLIDFFPRWLAPNVITLMGLACCIAAHALTMFYNRSWYGGATAASACCIMPAWAYAIVAFLIFAYQTLDNLDGRQARRTKTSSPLGLLFDHGVDALNATLTTLTVCACVCIDGHPWLTFQMWSQTVVPFIHATWEEYYVGELYLGVANGPTEGILLACGFIVLNSVFGPGVYASAASMLPSVLHAYVPVWVLQKPGAFIVCSLGLAGCVPTVLSNYYNVYSFLFSARRQYATKDANIKILASAHPNAHELSLIDPLLRLSPFVVIWGGALVWAWHSPSNVLATHTRTFLFAHGFLFCSFICRLMLAHLSLQRATTALHWALAPSFLAMINALVLPALGMHPVVDEVVSVQVFLGFTILLWLHLVLVASREIATALGINVLSLTAEQLKADAEQQAKDAPKAAKKQL